MNNNKPQDFRLPANYVVHNVQHPGQQGAIIEFEDLKRFVPQGQLLKGMRGYKMIVLKNFSLN